MSAAFLSFYGRHIHIDSGIFARLFSFFFRIGGCSAGLPGACHVLRAWSAIARSLTVISYCDCISACIIVSMIIVDCLVDKHREQVFPKDEITESMIS